jgi:hypothetical protein
VWLKKVLKSAGRGYLYKAAKLSTYARIGVLGVIERSACSFRYQRLLRKSSQPHRWVFSRILEIPFQGRVVDEKV